MATSTIKKIKAEDIKSIGTYSRSDIGTSPNYDSPEVNGLFEVRTSSEVTATGTRPFDSYGPMLSLKTPDNLAMMQLAIQGSGGSSLQFRGRQAGGVNMDDIPWQTAMTTSNYLNYVTPANIGAVAKTGDTMTGSLGIDNGWLYVHYGDIVQSAGNIRGEPPTAEGYVNHGIKLGHAGDDHMQFFEYGGKFTYYQAQNGTYTPVFEIKNGTSGAPLRVDNGGTGATDAAGARSNLGITPANIGAVAPGDLVREVEVLQGSSPKGASTEHTAVSFTKAGYRPLLWSISPSGYCDYLCLNLHPTVSGDTLTTGTYYTGNWTNADVNNYTIYINILWIKK